MFGYVLAIVGGTLLYQNSPRDLATGAIPRVKDIQEHMQQEQAGIERRQNRSRIGFLLITVAAIAQRVRTLAQRQF